MEMYPTMEQYVFPSVENAYQAAKTFVLEDQKKFQYITAAQAKRLGRRLKIRNDWNEVKLKIMKELVTIKFEIPELQDKLLATGDKQLIEGNYWNDRYWGQCPIGVGTNHLGKILMKVRTQCAIRRNETQS